MKNRRFPLIAVCLGAAVLSSQGATVPAGTTLVARTTGLISSHARVGNHFSAVLDQNVVLGGKVVLPAGTHLRGVITKSRANNTTQSTPLTLDLTSVSIHGKSVPIKTTGGFQPQPLTKTARQSRAGFSVGETNYAAGTRLEFRLAQPLQF